jgi:hypothetical protein
VQAMGLTQDSLLAASNKITLGMAAASLGALDEAVQALEEAVRLTGPGSPPSAQAKARTALARVRLWLGEDELARALVEALPPGTAVGQRMQAALIVAQAEQMAGRSGEAAYARLARLGAEHADLPPMLSAWLEWSYQGEADAALARLRDERIQLQALGLPGAARALQLRELARMGDRAQASPLAAAQAAALAAELLPQVASGGVHAKVYPGEAWWVLHQAFARVGDAAAEAQCRGGALQWLQAVRLPQPTTEVRERFLARNPFNRAWLALPK